jgi:hypothetical protein
LCVHQKNSNEVRKKFENELLSLLRIGPSITLGTWEHELRRKALRMSKKDFIA